MACLQWGTRCHPPAFLLAKGKLCSVKHIPEALFFLHGDKMGDEKKDVFTKMLLLYVLPSGTQEGLFSTPVAPPRAGD